MRSSLANNRLTQLPVGLFQYLTQLMFLFVVFYLQNLLKELLSLIAALFFISHHPVSPLRSFSLHSA
jgi:hypothetical protein